MAECLATIARAPGGDASPEWLDARIASLEHELDVLRVLRAVKGGAMPAAGRGVQVRQAKVVALPAVAATAPKPQGAKRGRPKGSKNRPRAAPAASSQARRTIGATTPPAAVDATWAHLGKQAPLWASYQADPCDAHRNALVERYLPLVRGLAMKLHGTMPATVELDTLVSDGVLGLMDAIARFDPARGWKFETYSPPRIGGAMRDGLRMQDHVPRLARTRGKQFDDACQATRTSLGREPTAADVAEHLGVPESQVQTLARDAHRAALTSLEHVMCEGDSGKEVPLKELIPCGQSSPRSVFAREEFWRRLLRGANRDERLVVLLYYRENYTLREIGRTLDLCESRVSQMHSQLLARYRLKWSTPAELVA